MMRIFFFLFICVFNVSFSQTQDSSAVLKTSTETPKTSLKDSIKKSDTISKSIKTKMPVFEGIITYQKKLLNPNPLLISDDEFYQTVENKGISKVKVFVKGNKYKMVSKEYISIFDPIGYRVCTKDLIKEKDTFYCLPANLPEDKVQKIEPCGQKATILDKACLCFLVKSPFSTKTVFYNSERIKTSPGFWANHFKDDWGPILQRAGAFPLKIITKSSFGNEEREVIKIEAKTLSAEDFEF
jgi:hypothetical protein